MQQFIDFLINNYKLIIVCVSLVLNIVVLIVLICKKFKAGCFASLLMKLPDFINQAEAKGLKGTEKYTLVFSLCISYLCSAEKISTQECKNKYALLIDEQIEKILSTPEKKKGDN